MSACLLILLGFCHPTKAQILLNAGTAAVTVVDTYSTQRNFSLGPHPSEDNRLARPFETHGAGVAYAAAAGEAAFDAWLAHKLKESHNRVLRRIWWMPQAASIAGHAWAAEYSFGHGAR